MTDPVLLRAAQGGVVAARLAPQLLLLAGRRGILAADPGAPAPNPAAPANPAAPNPGGGPAPGASPPAPSASSPGSATTGEFPTILLTCLIWSSLLVGLVILLLPDRTREQRGRIRLTALLGTAIPFVLAAGGLFYEHRQDVLGGGTSFEENHAWITSLPVHVGYHLAADGVSLPLLLLSSLLFGVAVLASWRLERRIKLYFLLLLVLETGVNGTFCAFDYALFFLFYEVELIPMFLLIAVWGGENRMRAAWKFLGFTICSTGLLLAAVILVGVKGGQGSFELLQNAGQPAGSGVALTRGIGELVFWLSFVAFAIKLPVVPLHTWLPDAHTEASAPISVILAGVLLKLGGYGMLRICLGGFPQAAHHFSLVIAILAAATAVWGTLGALAQDDLKRLVAYGSVGHMAMVLLAVSAQSSIALNGAVLQMVAHGLSTAMLFLLAGAVQERARTRSIARLGGLAWQMPRFTALWVFAGLASLGLPFLAGFVAEFEIFVGAFPAHRVATVVVMASVAVTTGYLLWMVQRVFFGPSREVFQRVRDAGTLELAYLLPLAGLVVVLGVLPGLVTPIINNGVQSITARLSGG